MKNRFSVQVSVAIGMLPVEIDHGVSPSLGKGHPILSPHWPSRASQSRSSELQLPKHGKSDTKARRVTLIEICEREEHGIDHK